MGLQPPLYAHELVSAADSRISSLSFHPMVINEKPLRHWIDNFYGYGAWNASFWFVAYEETGGELPEDVAMKLDFFYERHAAATEATLCDIREMYPSASSGTGSGTDSRNGYEYRFGERARLNTVWRNLAAFAHGYKNEALPDMLEYQKNVFASPSAREEAMIRLYPLPRSNHHAWYYGWLDLPQFPFLQSAVMYQEHLYEERMHTILKNIGEYRPKVVLMYGMENINMLKKSVQEFFPVAKFRMVKAVKRQLPQHHRAELDGTLMLITTQIPALRHHRIETGFDWYEFGKSVGKLEIRN
jgi:hypothetical protein